MTYLTTDNQGRLKIVDGSSLPSMKRTANADGSVGSPTVSPPVKVAGFANTNIYENGLSWDGVNNRVNIPKAGKYEAILYTTWEQDAGGIRAAHITKNTSGTYAGANVLARENNSNAGGSVVASSSATFVGELALNDHLEFWVGQNSGGTISLLGANGEAVFWISVRQLPN